MAKHIGIVACSAEGAALCYRTICSEATTFMGEHTHPEITMHTHPLGAYMVAIRKGDWQAVANLMLSSTRIVAQAGADFAISPDNTIHQAYDLVVKHSPIPYLHIAEVVAQRAKEQGFQKLAILGTRYLMEGPVYPSILRRFHLNWEIPEVDDREKINTIIFKELVNGIFREDSRLYFNQVMEKMEEKNCDAAVLGCTEIPLLVEPEDAPLPTLDSTRLLARAALQYSLK